MKSILVVLLSVVSLYANAQVNLVSNGNFESGTYNGGLVPSDYYSECILTAFGCESNEDRFNDDVNDWSVADAPLNYYGRKRDSPDYFDSDIAINIEFGGHCQDTRYIRCATPIENVMIPLNSGHTLIPGETYHFKIKARAGVGANFLSHNFQLYFTSDIHGLSGNNNGKWIAGDFYLTNSCNWTYIDYYFTVPTDNNKNYDQMNRLVLYVNYYRQGTDVNGVTHDGSEVNDLKAVFNFDDVVLIQEEECIDIKYIQNREYINEAKIVQANQEIIAGYDVSPYSWDDLGDVVVKNGSYVIYRAPVVTLDPTGFEVEPGGYFETQFEQCVEDPCPAIPSYSPEITTYCNNGSNTLGTALNPEPGVFFVWQPEEYFTAPWSAQTDFVPPNGNGCVDASLTIWTICGESQVFNFPVKYFDAAPTINFGSVVSNPNELSFDVNVWDASSYSIEVVNTTTGNIMYSSQQTISCAQTGELTQQSLEYNSCEDELCGNVVVNVIAENECFGTTMATYNWNGPTPSVPTFQIDNLVSNDYEYNFDVTGISADYEFIQIKVYEQGSNVALCVETIFGCDQPNLTNLHFDVADCLQSFGGCASKCKNYTISVVVKNNCNDVPLTQVIHWIKASSIFTPPVDWPNVLTANGDGINDDLCFNMYGADSYEIDVINLWGNIIFEDEGCVTEEPPCLWTPAPNSLTEGVYFYDVIFRNNCGDSVYQHSFVHIFNGMILAPDNSFSQSQFQENHANTQEETSNVSIRGFNIFPNPTTGSVNIYCDKEMLEIVISDSRGLEINRSNKVSKDQTIDLSQYSNGVYTVTIRTISETYVERIVLL